MVAGVVRRGFTLIELLIVMVVSAILVSGFIMLINPNKRINQANDSKIRTDVAQLAVALKAYLTDNSYYPAAISDLVSTGDLKHEPMSPSGDPYNYSRNSSCGRAPYNGCEGVLYEPLQNPVTTGNVWCWRSITGEAKEMTTVDCTQ